MSGRSKWLQVAGLALAATLAAGPLALSPAGAQAPAAQPDYHPSMGDLMTLAVQPRHLKIGIAGRARNWAYLGYEASELRNAFNRIARTIPTYNGSDTAALVNARIHGPLDQLEAAIKARDAKRFDAAYAEVTEACNVCHRSLNHDAVAIKAPDASAYADQDFRPR